MTFSGDPFRTLGLPAGASEAEIKRAYRALAKRYHPDSAAEAALPRFLAIQAAYDMLTAPGGRLRSWPERDMRRPATRPGGEAPRNRQRGADAAGAGSSGGSGSSGGDPGGSAAGGGAGSTAGSGSRDDAAREAREAREARAAGAEGATRDAYRARRSRPGPTQGPMGGPAWWAAGRNGPTGPAAGEAPGPEAGTGAGSPGFRDAGGDARRSAPPDASGPAGDRPGTGQGPTGEGPTGEGPTGEARSSAGADARRARRSAKVASLGSTSYDDAPRDPEPAWSGATWYGDTSGTYWTINPKEYADPRKHGPEYLARARRGASPARGPGAAGPDGPDVQTAGPAADFADDSDHVDAAAAPGVGDPISAAADAPPAAHRSAGRAPDAQRPGPRAAPDARRAQPPTPPTNSGSDEAHRASGRAGRATWATAGAAEAGSGAAWAGSGASVDRDPLRRSNRDGHGDGDNRTARPFDAVLTQRVIAALIAWPPLGFAASGLIGEATGCGRYAASCAEPASLLGWFVQPAVVALLMLVPILARPAAVASVAVGIAAIGGAAVLSAIGGGRAPAGAAPNLLLAILVTAYIVGLIGAITGRVPLPAFLRQPPDGQRQHDRPAGGPR